MFQWTEYTKMWVKIENLKQELVEEKLKLESKDTALFFSIITTSQNINTT